MDRKLFFDAVRKHGVRKGKPEHWATFQFYCHAKGLEILFNGVGNLEGDPFLNLQASGKNIHQTSKL